MFMKKNSTTKKKFSESNLSEEKNNSRKEDAALVQEALKGKQSAFRTLTKKYQQQVFFLLLKMVNNNSEAEDLTQEAFAKAFSSLKSFNNTFAFSNWLYKIATNNCIDAIRKNKMQTFSLDKNLYNDDNDEYRYEIPDSSPQPDKALIHLQRINFVKEAIQSLPEKYKKVITMRHLEEKDYDEIAKELKLPVGTVKVHIFRGRELLNQILRKHLREY